MNEESQCAWFTRACASQNGKMFGQHVVDQNIGVHCIMRIDFADCDHIIKIVEETGVKFSMAFQMRHDPVNQKIKTLWIIRFQFFVDSPSVGQGVVKFNISEASSISGATWLNVAQYKSVVLFDTVGTPTIRKNILTEFIGYAGVINKWRKVKASTFKY